jgi:biopolymer transport protein ExbD
MTPDEDDGTRGRDALALAACSLVLLAAVTAWGGEGAWIVMRSRYELHRSTASDPEVRRAALVWLAMSDPAALVDDLLDAPEGRVGLDTGAVIFDSPCRDARDWPTRYVEPAPLGLEERWPVLLAWSERCLEDAGVARERRDEPARAPRAPRVARRGGRPPAGHRLARAHEGGDPRRGRARRRRGAHRARRGLAGPPRRDPVTLRRRPTDLAPPGIDLTPAIDVVFNLIIFFLIASELNERTVEQLALPRADQARKAAPSRERSVSVNVLADGTVRARGVTLPDAATFLELEAAGCEREEEPGSPSALRLLIRADRDARVGAVHRVLDACQRSGIYRLSLGAEPDR